MTVEDESSALHARVLAFARNEGNDTFDGLASAIARFQARYVPGFRRLAAAAGSALRSSADIPAVPVDAFRATRVAVHPAELDAVRFSTSGTTGAAPGVHALRTTATYRALSLAWGRRALASDGEGLRTVVALAPPPGPSPGSSLGFMMRAFMEALDGRSLDASAPFDANAPERWLAGPDGVDVVGLERAVRVARERGEPVLLLATSFALVLLLDVLAGRRLPLPERSVVMTTGGYKGRTREIPPEDLTRHVAEACGLDAARVLGEYGMTELTSQLYEGTLPGGALHGPRGVFLPPPWLSVTPVDPETLAPVPEGEPGIARFVDLGNVDSAVAIVTQDVIERRGAGVVLRGRRPGAPLRGCSLAVEEMVLGARGA